MENSIRTIRSSNDLRRYGLRLNRYLPALGNIICDLVRIKENIIINEDIVLNILTILLPSFSEAFNSDIAFLVNSNFEIVEYTTLLNDMQRHKLKETEKLRLLRDEGIPLVVFGQDEPELDELKVNSILMVRLKIETICFFVGVCNGRSDEGPYLQEDSQFFDSIIKLISSILEIKDKSDVFNKSRNEYLLSRYCGNWLNLSISSQNFVACLNEYDK